MLSFEQDAFQNGFSVIAGVDEAGRGPLAGPVVAAAVIFPQELVIPEIDDSKKLNLQKRNELYEVITSHALAWAWSEVDHRTIDRINILNASLMAMAQAVGRLKIIPDFILIDGNREIDVKIPQKAVVKGDSRSQSIAAGSIIAKVRRDRIMDEYHEKFPLYNFKQNKGYGTKEHIELIKKHGHCDIHRLTFKGVLSNYELF
jgi:ribonuclease HII